MVWIFVITIILMFIGCNLIVDEPFTEKKIKLFIHCSNRFPSNIYFITENSNFYTFKMH